MSLSKGFRQFHRWMSMLFTATVIANFVAMGIGDGTLRRGDYARATWRALLTGLYLLRAVSGGSRGPLRQR